MKRTFESERDTKRNILGSSKSTSINTTIIRNPYRREFLKKKFSGRTKAERIATKEIQRSSRKKKEGK